MANAKPKYQMVYEKLSRMILGGELQSGSKLDTVRALARQFEVTTVTVGKALDLLKQEGLIEATQGAGTFVKDFKQNAHDKVAIMMPMRGDFFSHLFTSILQVLNRHQKTVVPIDLGVHYKEHFKNHPNQLRDILESDIDSLIVDGDLHFPFEDLQKYKRPQQQLIFSFRCAQPWSYPSNRVCSNFEMVGQLAYQHLLSNGSKKIIVLSVGPDRKPMSIQGKKEGYIGDIEKGMLQMMSLSHLEDGDLVGVHDQHSSTVPHLKALIQDGFDAIFCIGDFRARQAYQAIAELGLKVGVDVPVLGLFNTPWVQSFSPSLSSISLNEQRIGELSAQLVIQHAQEDCHLVAPQLVERASTSRDAFDLTSAQFSSPLPYYP